MPMPIIYYNTLTGEESETIFTPRQVGYYLPEDKYNKQIESTRIEEMNSWNERRQGLIDRFGETTMEEATDDWIYSPPGVVRLDKYNIHLYHTQIKPIDVPNIDVKGINSEDQKGMVVFDKGNRNLICVDNEKFRSKMSYNEKLIMELSKDDFRRSVYENILNEQERRKVMNTPHIQTTSTTGNTIDYAKAIQNLPKVEIPNNNLNQLPKLGSLTGAGQPQAPKFTSPSQKYLAEQAAKFPQLPKRDITPPAVNTGFSPIVSSGPIQSTTPGVELIQPDVNLLGGKIATPQGLNASKSALAPLPQATTAPNTTLGQPAVASQPTTPVAPGSALKTALNASNATSGTINTGNGEDALIGAISTLINKQTQQPKFITNLENKDTQEQLRNNILAISDGIINLYNSATETNKVIIDMILEMAGLTISDLMEKENQGIDFATFSKAMDQLEYIIDHSPSHSWKKNVFIDYIQHAVKNGEHSVIDPLPLFKMLLDWTYDGMLTLRFSDVPELRSLIMQAINFFKHKPIIHIAPNPECPTGEVNHVDMLYGEYGLIEREILSINKTVQPNTLINQTQQLGKNNTTIQNNKGGNKMNTVFNKVNQFNQNQFVQGGIATPTGLGYNRLKPLGITTQGQGLNQFNKLGTVNGNVMMQAQPLNVMQPNIVQTGFGGVGFSTGNDVASIVASVIRELGLSGVGKKGAGNAVNSYGNYFNMQQGQPQFSGWGNNNGWGMNNAWGANRFGTPMNNFGGFNAFGNRFSTPNTGWGTPVNNGWGMNNNTWGNNLNNNAFGNRFNTPMGNNTGWGTPMNTWASPNVNTGSFNLTGNPNGFGGAPMNNMNNNTASPFGNTTNNNANIFGR